MSEDTQPTTPYVVVKENGPYRVHGPIDVAYQLIAADDEGANWTWVQGETVKTTASFELCRCGHSSNKPFCDGTHLTFDFDGTETASRDSYESQAEVFDGPSMQLADAESLCAFARFCDGHGSVWQLVSETSDHETREMTAHEATHCPAGRLVAHDKESLGAAIEPDLAPAIGVIEDRPLGVSGGLWLRGGIEVRSADGTPYPVRNRQVLCRCGASGNKPFCDGSHARIKFADPMLAQVSDVVATVDSVTTPEV